jgi:hypothetical protein
MKTPFQTLARAVAGSAIALASMCAAAAADQTVVQSTDYGLIALPFTQGFNLSLVALPADDTFLSDYGFSIGTNGSFTSAVVTFDLASAFQLSDLSVSLLQGSAWSGAVPADLSAAQIANRDSRILATGSGSSMTQMIDQMQLGPGDYVVEVSGRVTGANGGSFGGLLNVAAVPEPAGYVLSLAGFGLLAFVRRRARR